MVNSRWTHVILYIFAFNGVHSFFIIRYPKQSNLFTRKRIREVQPINNRLTTRDSNKIHRRYATNTDEFSNDWNEAERAVSNFPEMPSPDIEPEDVLQSCLRSLQFVDHPTPSEGLKRCFPFFTWMCRKVVTARQGGDTVERFMQYGELSPALQPFMGATRIEVGDGTFTSGSNTRGDLMSYLVTIHGSTANCLQHSSGFVKDGISSTPPVTNIVVRLERNRRPPMQGCWLIREVMDVNQAFAGDKIY